MPWTLQNSRTVLHAMPLNRRRIASLLGHPLTLLADVEVDGWIDGCMYSWVGGVWLGGWIAAWMDGLVGGLLDGLLD